ncbi:PAS domain-containing hybrid sensor histidine kinase/response regulator [Noviherbaspirillum autotrophicum]|uniref:PAS domain-containing hybrid sensor histidine kinase/response regulator n=1 Tax=Noviherbaspirillum autotrophicum TaxID=709839 RepID=UPI0018DF96EC|nr:PAS domain-containing protein [Noviherbaspirillum autotrophicum]
MSTIPPRLDHHPGGQRYRHLIELCVDGVFLLRDARIVGSNRAALDLLGCSNPEQVHGHSLFDFLHPDGGGAVVQHLRSTVEEGPANVSLEHRLMRDDGTGFDAEITVAPYPDMDDPNGRLVVLRNLTERRHIAAALDQQDQYLRLITDAVPILIAYIDSGERYRFVNAAYEPWFKQPRSEIVGKSLRDALGAAYPALQPQIARALAGERIRYEATVDNDLGRRHVIVSYTPDIADDGKVRGFSSTVIDITERKNAEQELREQEKQLRLITDALPVFIAQCDRDYRLRFVNRTYADRFGYRAPDVIGRRVPDIVGQEAFARIRQYLDAALAGQPQEHEMRINAPGGEERCLQLMYVPERDEHGAVRGVVAAVNDVTRLRRAEEQLLRREIEFKTLVENSPDIISRIDRNMRHLYVNPAVVKLAGIEPSDYIGKTKAELGLPPAMVAAWDEAAKAAFRTGREQRLDFDNIIDGQTRFFSGRMVPETDPHGRIESVVAIAYDVTERARAEKERDDLLVRERAARIQAETAARARDEFLAIVSHELRAPLNGIQSWAHVLENYLKDVTSAPLAQRALQGIKTGVGQQVRLIEDLLDVTRMMSGKLRLVKQPLALVPLLEAAVESVRPTAAAKNIAITCTYRIADEQIEGDSDRVQQIFWNLLSNAVKFTPQNGSVWLAADKIGAEIRVTVRDNGMGISSEFLPHLFDRFSQEDTSSTRDHSGLGLGLFLVRHLVELHGGQVRAESAGEGQGTMFSVSLPLRVGGDKYAVATLEENASANLPLPSLEGLRILLIDDQAEARESLTVVLTTAGADVFAADSAQQVLAWLPTLADQRLPDVLVCDIAMPGEDGYAVLRKLRAWKPDGKTAPLQRMPALALTAFAQREDRIRALTAGFQMHVTKPVAPEELIVVIDTMVARTQ